MAQTAIKPTITTEQPRVVAVNPTRNQDWVQLVVRCEREKKNNNSSNQEHLKMAHGSNHQK